jgi:mannose-6-phosphate isomerase-like protein (cupin superfamily)|tara:strand:+ start:615 stop:1004 length:390 start_codon:yes stop_codon:yes gene_type:complete
MALQVSIEEVLSRPRAACEVFELGALESFSRGRGKATLFKLLPHPIAGVEFDRIELLAGGKFVGVPHKPGTREYLCCEKGSITLWTGGECYVLKAGDVASFQGDQKHSYVNDGRVKAVGFSVVAFVPPS